MKLAENKITRVVLITFVFLMLSYISMANANSEQQYIIKENSLLSFADNSVEDVQFEPFFSTNLIIFGTYPQTTAIGSDSTPIEWIVLDRKDNQLLLLSRYGLEALPFDSALCSSWGNCSLRKWLNNSFYNQAFTEEEKKFIITTIIKNDEKQDFEEWSFGGEANTLDRVFLLSYKEANQYLGVSFGYSDYFNLPASVSPTYYSIVRGAYVDSSFTTEDGEKAGCWWLRSPGPSESLAAVVFPSGYLNIRDKNKCDGSVRPAIWIDASSIE